MNTFPNSPTFSTKTDSEYPYLAGLTKREYFAAMAMQGLLANHQLVIKHDQAESIGGGDCFYEGIAQNALIHANMLISALNEDE
jgi:hypothetical protein